MAAGAAAETAARRAQRVAGASNGPLMAADAAAEAAAWRARRVAGTSTCAAASGGRCSRGGSAPACAASGRHAKWAADGGGRCSRGGSAACAACDRHVKKGRGWRWALQPRRQRGVYGMWLARQIWAGCLQAWVRHMAVSNRRAATLPAAPRALARCVRRSVDSCAALCTGADHRCRV